ncbi:MAG: ECF transporter S component [Senegalia sp. (in: firmicutes)]|uniref:ECF transporter S component n=1 Tax=Senegalia sp. (in: firmicutes) TaxID=1924098 RepID=UPI003F984BF3
MDTKKLVRTALLLALALVFQIGFRQFAQPIVGPLLNMTLILAALMIGPTSAVIIGTLTPIIAFSVGIIGLAPLIPIIVIGNILFVLAFFYINNINMKYSNWIALVISALIKFGFLALSVRMILPLFIPKVPMPIIAAFTLPQLYTAIIGGILAIVIYPLINRA